jgi:hypothetical protein
MSIWYPSDVRYFDDLIVMFQSWKITFKNTSGLQSTCKNIQTFKISNIEWSQIKLDINLVFSWVSEVFCLSLFFILLTLDGLK